MNETEEDGPLPDDFCNYLPWACNQLGVPAAVVVTRILQNETLSTLTERRKNKSRIKLTQSTFNITSDQDVFSPKNSDQSNTKQLAINVAAVYSNSNSLVEIRFEKNRNIPRVVLKVIRLIVHFYCSLNRIYMNEGVNKYTVHEINGIIKASHITEICLDNCFFQEGNYFILLERGNSLRYLSLSKCKINDVVLEEICKKLKYPEQASETLVVLNLSTNLITDAGAKFIAEALRSNRKLSCLNLADNSITDVGVDYMLGALQDFPLRNIELEAARIRQITYLKEKLYLIKRTTDELLSGDINRKSKRKVGSVSAVSLKKRKSIKNPSLKSRDDEVNYQSAEEIYGTALKMVEEGIGEFDDPFMSAHNIVTNDITYCKGNFTLNYIDLSYNNLTFLILKKVLDVLTYQKQLDKKQAGLLKVMLEGNYLPVSCIEMKQLDDLIEAGAMSNNRKVFTTKKKPQGKTSARP